MKLYYINKNYINYLRQYDDKVMYKDFRPYVGIIYEKKDKKYFLPITSTNYKKQYFSDGKSKFNPLTMVSINNGKLGTIKLNVAIPVNNWDYRLIDVYKIKNDKKRRKLIKISKKITNDKFCNKIKNKFDFLFNNINKDKYKSLRKNCCDFNKADKCSDMYQIIKENDDLYNKLTTN